MNLFYGLLNMPWWAYIIITLVMVHVTMISITVYLHRHQAHRALTLHPVVAHFFRFWLWLTTGMKTNQWVAVHRKHHAFSDEVGDPHSPVVEGVLKVLFEGAELYRQAKTDPETIAKYSAGTPNDWLEKYVYSAKFLHGKLGVVLMLYLDILLLGEPGIIVWGIQMIATPFLAAGIINGLGHFFGYRNYECADAATNIVPWGIVICGEELHNNHHAYPTSAKFSLKPFEFDMGWVYIRLLSFFRLAKVKHLPPEKHLLAEVKEIDIDAVKGVLINRLQLISKYGRDVIKPVFESERKSTLNALKYQSLSRKVYRLVIRHKRLLKKHDQHLIENALKFSQNLTLVCQYRERLQMIWEKTAKNNKELISALQKWCKDAEESGVDALVAFSGYIKRHRVGAKSR